jgi:hypothetical protein
MALEGKYHALRTMQNPGEALGQSTATFDG